MPKKNQKKSQVTSKGKDGRKNEKETEQSPLHNDSQTRERMKPPPMIIKSKIDAVRF